MAWVPGSAVSVHPMGELWTSVDQQNVVRFQQHSLQPTCGCTQGEGDVSRSGVQLATDTANRSRCRASDAGTGLANPGRPRSRLATLVATGVQMSNAASDSRTVGDAVAHPSPGRIGGTRSTRLP